MKLDNYGATVRAAVIGYGCRGKTQMEVLLTMPDVEIVSVCDAYEDRARLAADVVEKARGKRPFYSTNARACMDRDDVDCVFVFSSWETHIAQTIEALDCGKRVAMEVGGSQSVEECWSLVRKSEETGTPVMLLENCCYGENELNVLNMIRKGLFGTIVHCEGAYAHDLRDEVGNGDINRHYRQRHFLHRNGELYPTHELGPIATYLNINRGNRMVSLVSMASKACGLHEWLAEHRSDNPALQAAQVNEGDIVTTLIKCANGETIILKHDCTLPRPYSRGGVVRGTKGIWQEDNHGIYIDGRSPHDPDDWMHHFEDDAPYMKEYQHPIWTAYHEIGARGGHGGMDFLVLRAFVESVQKNEEPPIDVYDAASWMAITALSEESIACGSVPVAIPDFTNGKWLLDRKGATGTFALH